MKPTGVEAESLSKLFPSSSSASTGSKRIRTPTFDPTADLVVGNEKRKKKAVNNAQGRPTSVKVMALKSFTKYIPRGKQRSTLKKADRERSLLFKRSMTSEEVRCTIAMGFSDIAAVREKNWTYLQCDCDNHLAISKNQALNGNDVINRKGSLYICELLLPTQVSFANNHYYEEVCTKKIMFDSVNTNSAAQAGVR